MAWTEGVIKTLGNYHNSTATPLDGKTVVASNAELEDITAPYNGLIVHVAETSSGRKTYVCINAAGVPTSAPSGVIVDTVWKEMGGDPDVVIGPSSVTDGNLAAFDGTTGKLLKDGGVVVAELVTPAKATGDAYFQFADDLTDSTGGTLGTIGGSVGNQTFDALAGAPSSFGKQLHFSGSTNINAKYFKYPDPDVGDDAFTLEFFYNLDGFTNTGAFAGMNLDYDENAHTKKQYRLTLGSSGSDKYFSLTLYSSQGSYEWIQFEYDWTLLPNNLTHVALMREDDKKTWHMWANGQYLPVFGSSNSNSRTLISTYNFYSADWTLGASGIPGSGNSIARTKVYFDNLRITKSAIYLSDVGSGLAIPSAPFGEEIAISSGGTGQKSRQAALDSMTGGGTTGQVLTWDGSNAGWATSVSGDVTGPSSSTDNHIVTFDAGTGKVIQDSGTLISGLATSGHNHTLNSLSVPTGDVSLNSKKITNLATPVNTTDAASKTYVDTGLAGKAASTHTHAPANITTSGASTGDVLTWDGSAVDWAAPSGGGGSGDVTGPGSSTDNHIVTFDGNTGKIIQDSTKLLSDYSLSGHNHSGVYAPNSHTHGPTAITVVGASSGDVLTWDGSAVDWAAPSGGGSSEWGETSTILHPAGSSGAQTVVIGGTSTANSDIVLNADGSAVFNVQSAAVDFLIKGDTDAELFFVDGSADKIGIGTNAPNELVTMEGALSLKEISVPSHTADHAKLYAKDVSGVSKLFAKDSAGTEIELGAGGGGGGSTFTAAGTAPGSPALGDHWYDTTNNILYVRVEDSASTDLWLDISTAGGAGSSWSSSPEDASLDGVVAVKKQTAAPSATADYAKIYSKLVPTAPAESSSLFHFDGNLDDSVPGNPRMVTPGLLAPTFDSTPGNFKFGTHSLKFIGDDGSGNGSFAIIPSNGAIKFGNNPFTIDFWLKVGTGSRGTSGTGAILLFGTDLSDGAYGNGAASGHVNFKVILFQDSHATLPGVLRIYMANSSDISYVYKDITGLTSADFNDWQHIAVVRESTSNQGTKIYIDGVKVMDYLNNSSGALFTIDEVAGGGGGERGKYPGMTFGRDTYNNATAGYTYEDTVLGADIWLDGFNIINNKAKWVYATDGNFTPPGEHNAGNVTKMFIMDSDGNETKLTP